MSQRHLLEERLSLYDDLSGIVGAMRNFALSELSKAVKREQAQQNVVKELENVLSVISEGFSTYKEAPLVQHKDDVWLLMGSVRGFCGSFNEDVVRFWKAQSSAKGPVILVGERLHNVITDVESLLLIDGAESCLDTVSVIDKLIQVIQGVSYKNNVGLIVCFRDKGAVKSQRLWPLADNLLNPKHPAPMTYAALDEVIVDVAEHYLFHKLLIALLQSILEENHLRLIQMEAALRHLDEGRYDLVLKRNRLRQEEIVEEIELMSIWR